LKAKQIVPEPAIFQVLGARHSIRQYENEKPFVEPQSSASDMPPCIGVAEQFVRGIANRTSCLGCLDVVQIHAGSTASGDEITHFELYYGGIGRNVSKGGGTSDSRGGETFEAGLDSDSSRRNYRLGVVRSRHALLVHYP